MLPQPGHFELFRGFRKSNGPNLLAGAGDYSWFKTPGPSLICDLRWKVISNVQLEELCTLQVVQGP